MDHMTLTETDPAPETAPPGLDSTLVHWLCLVCYPDPQPGDKALCGYRLVSPDEIPVSPEDTCVVCEHMSDAHFGGHLDRGEAGS
jgi:hypothetical protein